MAFLVLGLVVLALVLWPRANGGDEGILPDEDLITSYRIVYEIEELGGPARTEERVVDRPYLSKTVSTGSDGAVVGTITNDEGRWLLASGERGWQLRAEGRQRALDDTRPIEALEAAAEDGRAESRGVDTVLGRRCTIVRTGGPLGDAVKPPTADEYADLCVDRTGAVLRERWVLNGRLARTILATTFEVEPRLDPTDFEPTPRAEPLPEGLPGIARSRAVAGGESAPPEVRAVSGYRADGLMTVTEREVGARGLEVTYVQRFVDGADLIVVEQGTPPVDFSPPGTPIDLGRGSDAILELGLNSSSITMSIGSDRYVRITGVGLDELRAFAEDIARSR